MNKESNLYTFLFAIIMVLVVGTVLAVTSEVLQPRKKQNAADKKMIDILSAIGVDATRNNAKEKYTEYIYDASIIDYKGNLIEGSAFDIDVLFQYRDKTLLPEDKKYPMFKARKNNSEYTIIPMVGSGLWGPVWGFLALEKDYNTVYGAVFDHEKETPGLGAEINTDFFEVPFKGKKIRNSLGQFVSIEVKKGGADKGSKHQVDGITGGTITSDGVAAMLENTLEIYNNYFSRINFSLNDTIIQSLNNNIE
ncbi:MAG: NADH:ubiquinone reductase (Na(+)-transporting) subunit C [Flavobacteriales bacterium]|nr:NADH:ubiquinone reductase (Na(+)-transporting) subunit C [Flavobacteriales bacterium]|tara:strand:+ start:2762 stop:3514 length:753 start_codon:yes stop_codon:yes gene_type:complete